MTGPRMIDAAEDLMHDVARRDAARVPGRLSASDNVSAAVMRRIGYSEADIAQALGGHPSPEPAAPQDALAMGR